MLGTEGEIKVNILTESTVISDHSIKKQKMQKIILCTQKQIVEMGIVLKIHTEIVILYSANVRELWFCQICQRHYIDVSI